MKRTLEALPKIFVVIMATFGAIALTSDWQQIMTTILTILAWSLAAIIPVVIWLVSAHFTHKRTIELIQIGASITAQENGAISRIFDTGVKFGQRLQAQSGDNQYPMILPMGNEPPKQLPAPVDNDPYGYLDLDGKFNDEEFVQ